MSEAIKSDGKITGHVYDEASRAVGGVKVQCDKKETLTLFDGSYKFLSLSPGSHIIEVELEGYKKIVEKIETGEEKSTIIDFHLEHEVGGSKIYGHVLDSESMEPVKEGGSMYMFHLTSNDNTYINPTSGYYEFTKLPSGKYTIWTSLLEYVDEKKTITIGKDEERREDFYIRKKEDIEPPWG